MTPANRREPPAPAPDSAPDPAISPRAKARFAAISPRLRKWFRKHARRLPWREAYRGEDPLVGPGPEPRRSPYAVWVAEVMLQQTRVAAATGHFQRWMSLFPDPATLARATPTEVLRAWAGLGYYARARNLHKAARALVDRGMYPRTAEEWKALPGVGDYTAGAVASLAWNRAEPILDGNVTRVFSRLLGLAFLPGDGAAARRAYWDLARAWARRGEPGEINEAVMELGALVCLPSLPRCEACPLAMSCDAFLRGWREELPPTRKRPNPRVVDAVAVLAVHRGRVLAEMRGPGSFLAGHVLFPWFQGEDASSWRKAFAREFPGWRLKDPALAGKVKHSIMSTRYEVQVWRAGLEAQAPGAGTGKERWLPVREAGAALTNALARKIWTAGMGP